MRGRLRQAAAALGLLVGATAAAADPVEMRGLDFLVDWPKLVGQQVKITDGIVYGAQENVMTLKLKGGFAILKQPWTDREDLRFVLQNCDDLLPVKKCAMIVVGTVEDTGMGPGLIDVDFDIPH